MRSLDGITGSVGKFEQTQGNTEEQGSLSAAVPGVKKRQDLATEQKQQLS